MKYLTRTAISQAAQARLTALTNAVTTAVNPKDEADRRWKSKHEATFDEIRKVLGSMASGRTRCMYCEDSLGTDIDHFWPKANYPALAFTWSNYLLACSFCNSNLKRNLFPLDPTGAPLLIDPTTDNPPLHLTFAPNTGRYVAIDAKGDQSIAVFGLNDDDAPRRLPSGRKQAIIALIALLRDYQREVTNNAAKANEIKQAVCDFPFNAVFHWLVSICQSPHGNVVLPQDIVNITQAHNLAAWV
ncbi:hypothetical protein [Burkholderia glumae]|uniref:hypothetical protein n=1 Tax=Burkholderia glumae TaxID=337 RepID=UPI002150A01D|nr:hypothetical protein [Burkholderia glumae]